MTDDLRQTTHRRRAIVLGAAALGLPWAPARAQSFPSKPITLIVPWPPGGSTC